MLATGNLIRNHPFGVLFAIVGIVLAVRLALRNPRTAEAGSRLMLRLPMLGELLRKLAYSRSLHSLATLLSGNVPIIAAMEHSAKVAGNPEVTGALMEARVAIEHGRTLADALAETRVVPKTLLQMVSIGEKKIGRASCRERV